MGSGWGRSDHDSTRWCRERSYLMALGVLPHDLGQLRLVVEAHAVAQTTLRVLQDHGVASPELVEDIATP